MEKYCFTITDSNGTYRIHCKDIIRIESKGTYVIIHTEDGKYIYGKNIGFAEKKLKRHNYFFRIHASHIININKMRVYAKQDGGTAIMIDGSAIQVAKRRRNEFKKIL
jgi:two-component system LytT family response regulator